MSPSTRPAPLTRPRRPLLLLVAIAIFVTGFGSAPAVASATAESEPWPWPGTIELTRGGWYSLSQVDLRWARHEMVNEAPIGACGCQITAIASIMANAAMNVPALPEHSRGTDLKVSAPWFWTQIITREVHYTDLFGLRTRKVIEGSYPLPVISPHYVDRYLRDAGGTMPENWGYDVEPDACGPPPRPWALENAMVPNYQWNGHQLGPSGVTVTHHSGFDPELVKASLRNGIPVIVGRKFTESNGKVRRHVNLITGWDALTNQFWYVDPVASSGTLASTIPNPSYPGYIDTIETTIEVTPVVDPLQHLVIQRTLSDPAPVDGDVAATSTGAGYELAAVLADGRYVGYEPTTGEHHSFRGHSVWRDAGWNAVDDAGGDPREPRTLGLMTTDVEGTVRTRIMPTSSGPLRLNLDDVPASRHSGEVATLAVVDEQVEAGSEIKHETTYRADGTPVAVRVTDFTPEVVVADVAGVAGEQVALDASGSFDADGRIASTAWDFGDGATATGPTASHTWSRPGTHLVTVTVTSDTGQVARETVEVVVAPTELDAPSLTMSSSAGDGEEWTNDEEVVVTASASDDTAVESITIAANGTGAQAPRTVPGDTAEVVVTAEGRTTVTATATDVMANTSPQGAATVLLDRTPPTAAVASPGRPIRALPFLTGTAFDEHAGIDRVEVQITNQAGAAWDGDAWRAADSWLPTSGDAGWFTTTDLPSGGDLPDGRYELRARATDGAGNTGDAGEPVEVTIAASAGGGLPVEEQRAPQLGMSTSAHDVSDTGATVGHGDGLLINGDNALRWTDGVATTLPLLTGRTGGRVNGISDDGVHLVGQQNSSIGQMRAVAWVDGQPVDLGSVNGGTSVAHDVNDSGVAVGSSAIVSTAGASRAARFEGGIAVFLPDLGGSTSEALAINDNGVIVGSSKLPGQSLEHAFKIEHGVAVDLGAAGTFSTAFGVNDAGEVVGTEAGDAVLWNATGRTVLGQGTAYDIADDGLVVGAANSAAMLWRRGEQVDLNSLIDPASGWILESASGITADGTVVVGTGRLNGVRRGFRLDLTADSGGGGETDTSAPTTVESISPAGADGRWVNGPVTVTLNADDGEGSGVAGIQVAGHGIFEGSTASITIDVPGTHTLAWAALDHAGNVESPGGTAVLRVDSSAPTAVVESSDGWYRGAALVPVAASDDGGSGLAELRWTIDGVAGAGSPGAVAVEGDGEHQLSVTAHDHAGNTSDVVAATVRVDGTAPAVSFVGLDDGAVVDAGTPLLVEVSDATSGIADLTVTVTTGDGAPRVMAVGEQLRAPGRNAVRVVATDAAGNATETTRIVYVETTEVPTLPAPVGSAPVADAGGPYEVVAGEPIVLDGSASSDADDDPLTFTWAIDGVVLPGEDGATVEPFAIEEPGTYAVQLTASDGSVTSSPFGRAMTTITVHEAPSGIAFEGFGPPVENDGVLNVVNAGRTIPMKWRLTDGAGPVSDPAAIVSLTSRATACSPGEPESPVEETTTARSGLLYEGDGRWHYNWATARAWAGTCRVFTLTLADASTHTAVFRFR